MLLKDKLLLDLDLFRNLNCKFFFFFKTYLECYLDRHLTGSTSAVSYQQCSLDFLPKLFLPASCQVEAHKLFEVLFRSRLGELQLGERLAKGLRMRWRLASLTMAVTGILVVVAGVAEPHSDCCLWGRCFRFGLLSIMLANDWMGYY